MLFRVNPNHYTTIPTRHPDDMHGLSQALAAAAPANPNPALVDRIARMVGCADVLQSAYIEANRPTAGSQLRILDAKMGRAWRGVYAGLNRWVKIQHPKHGARAAELIALILPTGLDFLGFGYAQEWAQSERKLRLIADDGLTPEIVELANQEFLDNLLDAHKQFGEGLRITKKADGESMSPRIIEHLRALRTEIAGYARLVLGLTDENDQAAVDIAEAALEPILRFRKDRAAPKDRAAEVDELEGEFKPAPDDSDEPSIVGE